MKNIIASALMLPGLALAHPGHDILEHSDIAADVFCVVSYALAVQIGTQRGWPQYDITDLESRGMGLAETLQSRAIAAGHTQEELRVAVEDFSHHILQLNVNTWQEAGLYLSCSARTEQWARWNWF